MDLAPGVVIAQRYELIRQLGEGGMGVVWSALHRYTQKPVALKFLKPPASAEMTLRFIREARAVGAVRHPNVIEIHDILKVITSGPITPIEQVAPHLPPQFSALVNRMLRHDRKERPVDLLGAIRRFARPGAGQRSER